MGGGEKIQDIRKENIVTFCYVIKCMLLMFDMYKEV